MTLYCNGEPCRILCGSKEEGWAAIQFEEEDEGMRDVPILSLGADDPQTEIYDRLYEANEEFHTEVDFSKHLPLRVLLDRDRVEIRTVEGTRVYNEDIWELEEDSEDTYEFVQDIRRMVEYVKMAYERPRLLMFLNRDKL